MIQILIGMVGFTFQKGTIKGRIGSNDEDKKAMAFFVCLGIIGFVFWNRTAAALYSKCLRITVSDAEMIYSASRLIRERSDKIMKEERERSAGYLEDRDKEIYKLNDDLMEKRSEISRLKTTIKEMMKIAEKTPTA